MSELICRHCKLPVTLYPEHYETHERMHWLCFHLVFEHEGDPDEPCGDPSCPWERIRALQEYLRHLGHDPGEALDWQVKQGYYG